jgi:hypothetical protein
MAKMFKFAKKVVRYEVRCNGDLRYEFETKKDAEVFEKHEKQFGYMPHTVKIVKVKEREVVYAN